MNAWDDKVSRQLSSHVQPYTRLQTNLMQIKRHVKNDARKGMVKQILLNSLLRSICSHFCKFHEWGKYVITTGAKSFWNNINCILKGSEPKLLALIASNKNVHESIKNLKVLIGIISAQLIK
jgi:hypothetical protein